MSAVNHGGKGIIDFDRIGEIKRLRQQIEEIQSHYQQVTKPILTDFRHIPLIYEKFRGVLAAKRTPPNPNSVYERKKFMVAALYFYSPRSLAGGKMRSGLRRAIMHALGMKTQASISDNCSNITVLYHAYREFRRDVDAIITEVGRELSVVI
jgi:hypothetical protein